MTILTTIEQEAELRAIAALVHEGRAFDARARVDAALHDHPASEALLAFGGMIAARLGDPAGVITYLEPLVMSQPDDRASRLNLAQAHIALAQFEAAERALVSVTRDATRDRLAAFIALCTGNALSAKNLYRLVVTAHPADADSWANLAQAELALGNSHAAVEALEEAISLRKECGFFLALSEILRQSDRPIERRKVMLDAVALWPAHSEVQLRLGLSLAATEDNEAAIAALKQAIKLSPNDPAAYLELGILLENNNRLHELNALIDQARERLGSELHLLEGWVALRNGQLQEAERHANNIPDTISPLRRFQLGAQVADRLGKTDEAFHAFTAMNAAAIIESPKPIVGPTYRALIVKATMALRDASLQAADDYAGNEYNTPVFIAGFPRSGTTLVDTMLGRISNIHVLEEQPLIPTIEHDLGGPAAAINVDVNRRSALRKRYFDMLRELAPDVIGTRLLDKHPLHMARLPLIQALFPEAPIVLVERHPYDVVLSCFMANFRLNHAMRSFTDLTEAARTYDAVWTAFVESEARLPLRLHRLRYERLIDDPVAEATAALKFLGERYSPEVIDNVAAAREREPIRTASYSQVTEPIYRRSAGRWRRYRRHLEPIIPILAPWAARMGYEEN